MSITTTLNYTGYGVQRQQQIMSLIKTYFNPGANVYAGQRAIGAKDSGGGIKFPAFMVELTGRRAEKRAIGLPGKFDMTFSFTIWLYLKGGNRDQLVQDQLNYADGLIKLFSDNALADGSGKYKVNPNYWFNSEMKALTLSPGYFWGEDNTFMRAVKFDIDVIDRIASV